MCECVCQSGGKKVGLKEKDKLGVSETEKTVKTMSESR